MSAKILISETSRTSSGKEFTKVLVVSNSQASSKNSNTSKPGTTKRTAK